MGFLKKMSKELFGVDPETLFEVIEENHSAKGYIQGGLSDLLFKKYMEKKVMIVLGLKKNHRADLMQNLRVQEEIFTLRKEIKIYPLKMI